MQYLKNRTLVLWALGLLLLAAVELLSLRFLQPLDNRLSDALAKAHSESALADPDIVLIDIDETSLHQMSEIAGSWPWPRAVYGELIEGLAAQKPKAIVFDILFSEADIYRPESDEYFNQVLAKQSLVYLPFLRMEPNRQKPGGIPLSQLGSYLGIVKGKNADPAATANLLLPFAVNEKHWRTGAINYLGDDDGIGRRYYVYLNESGWKIPSLPARVVSDLGYTLPEGKESILLKWRAGEIAYPKFSFSEVYLNFQKQTPVLNKDEFKGKILVIGSTASGLHDLRHTAISSAHPALSILANAIDNLKNGESLTALPPIFSWLISVALIGLMVFRFEAGKSPVHTGFIFIALNCLSIWGAYLLLASDMVVIMVTPLLFSWTFFLLASINSYLVEKRVRQHTVDTFGRFLDPHIVNDLVAEGQTTESFAGEDSEITVLFSDIRGFTTLSEQHSAAEIVKVLNGYFSRQVEVIFRHGGTLDKFIGDAIMAFWGAPRADEKQSENAILAALEMADQLEIFKQEIGEIGETFDIGIGIHTGPAVVGFIGSDRRQEYTAIGDSVNLASRIEGLTKGVCRIMVSEDSYERCRDSFDFHEHGSYKVKGREKEVRIYEPRRRDK